jgi:hypothetical protein
MLVEAEFVLNWAVMYLCKRCTIQVMRFSIAEKNSFTAEKYAPYPGL